MTFARQAPFAQTLGRPNKTPAAFPCPPPFSFTLKTKTHPRRQERLRRCFPWRVRTAQTLRTSVFPRAPGGRVLSGEDVARHKRASARQVTALATPVVALTYRPQTVHRRRSLFIKAALEGAGLSHPSSLAEGAVGRRPPCTPPMAPRGFRSRRPAGLLLPPAEPAQRRFLIRARRRVSALLEPHSVSRRQRATCR